MTEKVRIPLGNDEFAEVDPSDLQMYKDKAFEALDAIEEAKAKLKQAVDDMVATTEGLKKGVVGKFFKAKFKAEIDANSTLAKTLKALDAAV